MHRRLAALLMACAAGLAAQSYDLVIKSGRVMDPESALDDQRDVGIRAGRIAAVSATPLEGKQVIDAKGLVVAPGFIDLHAHGQDLENQQLQARDGVTSALELELGAADIEGWYRQREGKRLINSGATVGHVPLRMKIMKDPSAAMVPTGDAAYRPATEEEITLLRRGIELGLQQGALGVGFGIQYTPAASRWEILEAFRVAARFRAPVFVHIRHMGQGEPDALNALEEMIAASAITGAPVHVVHVTSSGLAQTPKLLQTIGEARRRAIDITTECYPYNAAMTELQSAIFAPGWQKVLGIDETRVEWVATGERLTAANFGEYRKKGGMVIMHMIPDAVVDKAVSEPGVMIASDGFLDHGKGHPRGSGTYARVLGLYVRQKQVVPLMEAIAKISYLPALRVGLRDKGRIRVGADADLTLFEAGKVIDKSTFKEPAVPSTGIPWVIVNGVPVVANGKVVENTFPGKPVRK